MDQNNLTLSRLTVISAIHLGVGMAIVTISSFLNAELKLSNWSTGDISIFLGIPVLFELARMPFAHLYDSRGLLKESLFLGLLISLGGLLLIPYLLTPVGNIQIIIAVSGFYFGSSILTTLVDANMTIMSSDSDRSRVAGVIQVFRLLGFAIGGVVGSILYQTVPFEVFILMVSIFYLVVGLISLFAVIPTTERSSQTRNFLEGISILSKLVITGMPLLMTVFLILYPIGLFMQDLILEPFAIDILEFDRENVGRLVAVWTTLTLFFVPVGVFLASRYSRIGTIIIGELMSAAGLVFFMITPQLSSSFIFYTGLVLFGIGNGVASAPAIGMMLDVCSAFPEHLALLLGFFGIMSTVGRSLAAVSAGLVLNLSKNNYSFLFGIEACIVILGLIPLLYLDPLLKANSTDTELVNPISAVSFDL